MAKKSTNKTIDKPTIIIPIDMIYVDYEMNARKVKKGKEDEEAEYSEVKTLASQMKQDGLLSPVGVYELEAEEKEGLYTYGLIFGFRRIAAARLLE